MSTVATPQFICHQPLGYFDEKFLDIGEAVTDSDPESRTKVGDFIILDKDTDPEFADPGQFKRIFYCVAKCLQPNEYTIHLALRSDINSPEFAKEKKAYDHLKGVNGVFQPLLIKIQGVFEYMIADLYNQGDLFRVLVQKLIPQNGLEEHLISYALVTALIESHLRGVIHRDIKLENILARQLEDGSFEVCLADYGMAFFMAEGSKKEACQACGSPLYVSVEDWEFMNKNQRALPADYARDNYALGIVLFALATGEFPVEEIKAKNGRAVGVKFIKKNFKLGIFKKLIEALVYNRRTHLPRLELIQQRMRAILVQTYPGNPRVQALKTSASPTAIAKWEKDEIETYAREGFLGKCCRILVPNSNGETIYDWISSCFPNNSIPSPVL